MLTTYLNTSPYTKLVLIEDSLQENGRSILDYLIKNHCKSTSNNNYQKHYFVFEGNFERTQQKYHNITCHDFVSDVRNWQSNKNDFETIISQLNDNSVIIIDSLAHCIYRYELSETYRILNNIIKNKKNILQTITILHKDLLEDDVNNTTVQYFQHLATLIMSIEPKFKSNDDPRIAFTYKKDGGNVIKAIETYKFDDNQRLITQPIKVPDSKQFIEETINNTDELLPENLSTFKISLSEKDKASRDQLVLPYLPKYSRDEHQGGDIHYTFDNVDDWDEEDPDDDLDI